MIQKDRYSQAFLFLAASSGLSVYCLRSNKEYLAAAFLLIGVIPLAYLVTRPARLHLSEEDKNKLQPEYKGENDCGFSPSEVSELDGIKVNSKRYKFVNGTDICLNDKGQVVPCGIGSKIMQSIGGGGLEPKSIKSDNCWN
jgi:hypothetical protein